MKIRIESIKLKKLGPLESLDFELGQFNLIYGLNETGKTYLVEFILQSLFRRASAWSLRDSPAEGSISLSGLGSGPAVFSPGRKKKLEDHWQELELGLPLNMSRLLVVKGGDLNLAQDQAGGVSREFLVDALSNQEIFNRIWNEIPATIQKAELVGGRVAGSNQGQIKDLNNLEQNLESLERLLSQVEDRYSRGPARGREIQAEQLQSDLDRQLNAKRHQAYNLAKQAQKLAAQKAHLSGQALTSLRDRIRDLQAHQQELKNLSEKAGELQQSSQDFLWLESAVEIWESNLLENKTPPAQALGYAGAAGIGAGLTALFLTELASLPDLFWPGLAAAAAGGLLLVLFLIQSLRWSRSREDSEEREAVRAGFQEKFGFLPKGLADLKDQKSKLHEAHLLEKNQLKAIDQKQVQIEKDKQALSAAFQQLTGSQVAERDWDAAYQGLEDQAASLAESLHSQELELTRLNIPEAEYLAEAPGTAFDPENQLALSDALDRITSELEAYYQELDVLKSRACEHTGDEITTPWPEVYHHLLVHKGAAQDTHRALKAELAAKIGLSQVLTRIQAEEDQKLRQELSGDLISDMLATLTGRYQRIDLVQGRILVEDPYRSYALEDLSTGAREQVLLALRLGIASRAAEGSTLFLILDDAFQHSDWERRELLVKAMVRLAKAGWQVIYLSMDDHIRDLFHKLGKAGFKKDYRYQELI